jgi:hypothetical protein
LAGKSKTPDAGFAQAILMSNINLNCDGSHCRHGYNEVRKFPSAPSSSDNSLEAGAGGDALYLCRPCFANENMRRYQRANETGRDADCPQVSWSTAEVVFDKHGEPFNGEAAVRQGIVKYHQSGDSEGNGDGGE